HQPVPLGQQVVEALLEAALLALDLRGLAALHLDLLLGAPEPTVDLRQAVFAGGAPILEPGHARERLDQGGARGVAVGLALAERLGGPARLALGLRDRGRFGGQRRLQAGELVGEPRRLLLRGPALRGALGALALTGRVRLV